ncbi:hypothetical protein AAHD62_22320 [Enterobacter hormaechei]
MDISPLLHALCAVTLQSIAGLLTGDWVAGAVIGCTFFIAREHTQAEYRWIAAFGKGRRAAMPWWGGFDWRAWNMASLFDWLVPVVVCAVVFIVIH